MLGRSRRRLAPAAELSGRDLLRERVGVSPALTQLLPSQATLARGR